MVDLRDYKIVIRDAVAAERERDKNWGWRVVRVNKNSIVIRWGYLDYIEEKDSFVIRLMEDDGDVSLAGFMPGDPTLRDSLYVWIGDKHWHDCKTVDEGIRCAVRGIANRAHNTF